jgi:hypothetical protein
MCDSYIKVLLVNKGKKPFEDELIICTTLFHGSCRKRNLTTLESLSSSGQSIRPIVANNKTASTVAFLAPGPNTDGTALYVGASWTSTGLRAIRSLVPAFSSRNTQNFEFTNTDLVSTSYKTVDDINRYNFFCHIAQEIGYFIMSPKANYSIVKLIQYTNFDAPDAHFDYLSLFSGRETEKVGNPTTKM